MKSKAKSNHKKAWIVAVDMGYGHQRAAYPLKDIAQGGIINANTYRGITREDRNIWKKSRGFYEFISRFKKVPVVGSAAWKLFDRWQEIPQFYPKRDLSFANFQIKSTYSLIKKNNWGKRLIDQLDKNPMPLITTFFIPAFMAEVFDYSGDIYCVATDADISRNWAPLHPSRSRIKYFAPTYRVVERLKLYGVQEKNILLTGFPLPHENMGNNGLSILKQDLANRLVNLDPQKRYISQYEDTIKRQLCIKKCPEKTDHPLTLTFAVGGAGAQRDLGIEIIKSLADDIVSKKIRVILVAGIHNDVNSYFKRNVRNLGLGNEIGRGIKIVFAANKDDYFKKFNKALRKTDIVWTKPSELSFYTGLGLPIIMAPPIGSQEEFNKRWLLTIGSGIVQEDPKYTNQWFFDWIKSGWFAEAAMQGFMEAPKYGTTNIERIIAGKFEEAKVMKTILQY